jgi:hypothetical protein
MRNHRHRDVVSDLEALTEYRTSMRALGRAAAVTRTGTRRRRAVEAVVDLDAERSRRRSNVLLLERPGSQHLDAFADPFADGDLDTPA